jgi:hypothetical protein
MPRSVTNHFGAKNKRINGKITENVQTNIRSGSRTRPNAIPALFYSHERRCNQNYLKKTRKFCRPCKVEVTLFCYV